MSDEHNEDDAPEADDLPDGEYRGVLDRFEGDVAVVLLEADEVTVGDVSLDRSRLPEEARHVDTVLSLTLCDDAVVAVRYDEAETERRAERSQSRFDRLSRRLGERDTGRDEGDEGGGNERDAEPPDDHDEPS